MPVERRVVVAEPRACRPTRRRRRGRRRRAARSRSSTASGKSFGSHAPQAQTTTSARGGSAGSTRRVSTPQARARAPASPAARRSRRRPARRARSAGRRRRARGRAAAPPPASAARTGSPSRRSVASLSSRKPPSPVPNHATPTGSNRRAPLSASSSRHSSSPRSARPRVPLGLAVREADEPRVAARRRAHVTGRVLLDERHVPAAPRQLAGGGGAEDARADDGRGAHAREPNRLPRCLHCASVAQAWRRSTFATSPTSSTSGCARQCRANGRSIGGETIVILAAMLAGGSRRSQLPASGDAGAARPSRSSTSARVRGEVVVDAQEEAARARPRRDRHRAPLARAPARDAHAIALEHFGVDARRRRAAGASRRWRGETDARQPATVHAAAKQAIELALRDSLKLGCGQLGRSTSCSVLDVPEGLGAQIARGARTLARARAHQGCDGAPSASMRYGAGRVPGGRARGRPRRMGVTAERCRGARLPARADRRPRAIFKAVRTRRRCSVRVDRDVRRGPKP